MRRMKRNATGVLALLVAAGAGYAGCVTTYEDYYLPLTDPNLHGDGAIPTACLPSESARPVGDDCGVFVSSSVGDDKNDGTKGTPMKTLAAAVARSAARARRV